MSGDAVLVIVVVVAVLFGAVGYAFGHTRGSAVGYRLGREDGWDRREARARAVRDQRGMTLPGAAFAGVSMALVVLWASYTFGGTP